MALLCYNTTTSPITETVTGKVIPASLSSGLRGQPVNVTSELHPDLTADPARGKSGGRTNANYATIQAESGLEFEWQGATEYATPGLVVFGGASALVTALTTPYTAKAGDELIVTALTSPGAVSVVLSANAPVGKGVKVVDGTGDANSNNVTITAAGGTINGAGSLVLNTAKGWVFLVKTGATTWVAVSSAVVSTAAAGGVLAGNYPNPSLAALAVLTAAINDLAVTTGKLNDLAVTTGKLAANAVTEPKLGATVRSAPATLSGIGTIDVTKRTTLYTSTGSAQAVVLPSPAGGAAAAGQRLTVIHTVDGGSAVITPAAAGNFATCTLTNRWESAEFEWSGTAWNVVYATPVAIIA